MGRRTGNNPLLSSTTRNDRRSARWYVGSKDRERLPEFEAMRGLGWHHRAGIDIASRFYHSVSLRSGGMGNSGQTFLRGNHGHERQ